MDGAAPFQPWTRADGSVNVKDERVSTEDAKSSQYENVTRPKHFQSTSLDADESLEPALAQDSVGETVMENAAGAIMDVEKMDRMQQIVENTLSPESRQNVTDLLNMVDGLSGAEKLLLYLRLPSGPPVPDPLKQPLNPLGSRSEIHQTVIWIQTHLEVDAEVSLPKQDVYDEYITYCMSTNMKPLSTADFGKVMKQVYPCVRPRRLGTRGNSRYCYAGLRKKVKLEVPQLPDLGDKEVLETPTRQNEILLAASNLIRDWAEKMLCVKFDNLCELAQHLLSTNCVDGSVLQPRARRLLMSACPPHTPTSTSTHTSNTGEGSCDCSPSSQQASPLDPQRGVIKQLKRKIQTQPTPSKLEKKTKIQEQSKPVHPETVLAPVYTAPQHLAPLSTSHLAPLSSPHLVSSPTSYHAPLSSPQHMLSPASHLAPPSTSHHSPITSHRPPPNTHLPPLTSHLSPLTSHLPPLTSHLPSLATHIKVETLMSPPSRPYYHTPIEDSYKPAMRQHDYRYLNPYYVQDHPPPAPQNLILAASYPVNYSNLSYSPVGSNVPINLSSNSGLDISQTGDSYKPKEKEPVEVMPYNVETTDTGSSLNLSTTTREDEWRPQLPPPSQHKIPPLPGKKMILEAYNNETMGSPRSTYSPQSFSKSTYSPGKDISNYSTAEYLPKKMRAVESGKLAATRVAAQADSRSPDRYHASLAPKLLSHNALYSPGADSTHDNLRQYVTTEPQISPVKTDIQVQKQYQTVDSSLVSGVTVEQNFLAVERKERNHLQQNIVDVAPSKSAPVTSEESIEPPNKAARGRPKKKTLGKAKYTKKQLKGQQAKLQCDHKDKDNCSTDCSVLAEEINKTGVICKEKHSEILNRERVISICNLDKHALDDYLNEGNSQEHEEELMQYFHHSDSQSNDGQFKGEQKETSDPTSSEIKTTMEHPSPNPNPSTSKNQSETLTNHFLGSNLDLHEDHSQGKNEKISELRALLAKNLQHQSAPAQVLTGDLGNSDTTQVTTEPSTNNVQVNPRTAASAFKAIGGPNIHFLSENKPGAFKEGSAAASLTMLSQRQQNMSNDKLHSSLLVNRNLNAARRVSFETPHTSQGLNVTSNPSESVPQSPTSRTNNFNFKPISTHCHSPSNKVLLGNTSKQTISPTKSSNNAGLGSRTNSPISTDISPFVSPRNTPVPRARLNCQKPVPNKSVSKKGCKVSNSSGLPTDHKTVGFAVPSEQICITKSPGGINRLRNLPMSAPPSPNILVSRYKPNCANNQAPQPQDSMSKSGFNSMNAVNLNNTFIPEINNGESSQPMSADAFSNEVSQFFTDCVQPYASDSNAAYRSQSVPLNKDAALGDNGVPYFECGRGQQNHRPFNTHMFLSYNNTPCNSVPQTPIPQEFCDFGSFTETCESINKACLNSESLDKIYNVLDKTAQENGLSAAGEGKSSIEEPLLSSIADVNLELSNSAKELSRCNAGFEESLFMNGVRKENQLASLDTRIWVFNNTNGSGPTDQLKRSSSIDFDLNELVRENKFYLSRSVPSTPLPYHHAVATDANHFIAQGDIISKSVPSTPLLPEERKMFSYANRDFLINGNSVDAAAINNVEEDPAISKLERVLESPLQGIVTFSDDCMVGISADLQPFSEQGITNENDLLEDLDKIGSQAYSEL